MNGRSWPSAYTRGTCLATWTSCSENSTSSPFGTGSRWIARDITDGRRGRHSSMAVAPMRSVITPRRRGAGTRSSAIRALASFGPSRAIAHGFSELAPRTGSLTPGSSRPRTWLAPLSGRPLSEPGVRQVGSLGRHQLGEVHNEVGAVEIWTSSTPVTLPAPSHLTTRPV